MIRTKEELKALFEQGDMPDQQAFIDLIDTLEDRMSLDAHISNASAHSISDLVQTMAEKASKTDLADAVAALVDSSPAALNTLNEFAMAMGNDPNFATTVTNLIASKANSADVYSRSDINLLIASFNKAVSFTAPTTISQTSGSVVIDWSSNQSYVQLVPTGPITYVFTPPTGPCRLQLQLSFSSVYTITWPINVVQYGAVWEAVASKKAIITLYYDGTYYSMMGSNEV